MCIILLAYETHPFYRLALAANRDEFYDRPTLQAAFWEDAPGIIGGRDLAGGGTWLGVGVGGRVAAITNYRDPASKKTDAPSRGLLVSDFLRADDAETPRAYLERLATRASDYDGFNLIVGDRQEFYYFSNRAGGGPQLLEPGVHGLSNHLLDSSWPKVERGKRALSELLAHGDAISTEAVFQFLADRTLVADESLPDTGVGLEVERVLSPLFIASPVYGTRCSTVVLIDRNENVTFIERTFDAGSLDWKEVDYRFGMRPA